MLREKKLKAYIMLKKQSLYTQLSVESRPVYSTGNNGGPLRSIRVNAADPLNHAGYDLHTYIL